MAFLKRPKPIRLMKDSKEKPGDHKKISGLEKVDRVIKIDQTPIGRTPRSNPATYTKVLDPIRELFSMTPRQRPGDIKRAFFL
ncbi:MAG: hypothetical protein CM1200mP30_24800 [Pseudomonadota bacterium]|nr:MAG: hypothetical protein CM1200mP30_24800 [Pseudomonadota bacterium]